MLDKREKICLEEETGNITAVRVWERDGEGEREMRIAAAAEGEPEQCHSETVFFHLS